MSLALYLLIFVPPTSNIYLAIRPLFNTPDNLNDVDLTATQRSLLGLDPNSTPVVTPSTQYSTPPRYPRSGTPSSAGSAWSRAAVPSGSTPGSVRRVGSGSPWGTPDMALRDSPLWNKGLQAVGEEKRRHSYGFTPLPVLEGVSTPPGGSVFGPGTPSPAERGSVPITSRWVFNQGRSRSGKRNSLTGF